MSKPILKGRQGLFVTIISCILLVSLTIQLFYFIISL